MIEATPRFIRHQAQTKRKDLKASKVTKVATMLNEPIVTVCVSQKEGEWRRER